jgi:hypothetical protein
MLFYYTTVLKISRSEREGFNFYSFSESFYLVYEIEFF